MNAREPQPRAVLLSLQVSPRDFGRDGAEAVIADRDLPDVGDQIVGLPAVPAVFGFHPEDQPSIRLGH